MVNNMVMMEKNLEQAHKLGAMQAMLIMKVVIVHKDLHERLNERREFKGHEEVKSSANLAGLEAELKKLKKRMDDIEKVPTGLHLEKVEPLFTMDILDTPLPPKFKMYNIQKPFEMLKQTPLIIPKGVDRHQTLVLARAKWKETPPA
ncbi:hypothetical protein CUMW_253040 [Citrus unshiu]|uniref:Uncharacterized protein n=1 Tax=Citrus unshiu TaxID=55188 RepID=A0A2H5QQS1_CITUN|nr:hypothetical protein CUMW_253040 [Citrus unshiu]